MIKGSPLGHRHYTLSLLSVSPSTRQSTLTAVRLRRREMEADGEGSSVKGFGDPAGLEITGNRHGNLKVASTDQTLAGILGEIKSSKNTAVINYGASWCRVCSQILPAFCKLSDQFPKLSFVYADIDECPETTKHIRYTPTFQFYRDGERVDEMFGTGEERLRDRLWLHS